jgi:hypothetical protein
VCAVAVFLGTIDVQSSNYEAFTRNCPTVMRASA